MFFGAPGKLREIGTQLSVVPWVHGGECLGSDVARFHAHDVEVKECMRSRRKLKPARIGVQGDQTSR